MALKRVCSLNSQKPVITSFYSFHTFIIIETMSDRIFPEVVKDTVESPTFIYFTIIDFITNVIYMRLIYLCLSFLVLIITHHHN